MNKKAQVIKGLQADKASEMYKQGVELNTLVDSLSGREWQLFLELLEGWFLSCT